MSDSDDSSSSSDCSSSAASYEDNPVYNVKSSAKTVDTTDSSDSSDDDDSSSSSGESFGSDSSDDEKPAAKPKQRKSDPGFVPEGISEEAMKAFFSTPVDHDESESEHKEEKTRKAPERTPSIGLDASEHMAKHTEMEMQKRHSELSQSTHSLKSCEELLESFEKDMAMDEPDVVVEDVDIAAMAEEYKKNKKKEDRAPTVSQTTLLKNKREMRLAKVRERLRKKEEAKEREEDQMLEQKMKDAMCPTGNLDMSEAARRDRAYSWYTRMAMPTKEAMKEKVELMPTSAGLTVDDVDLLPWSMGGKMVNVAKMQKFINEGFKKKFTSRRKKKAADSDSDSD